MSSIIASRLPPAAVSIMSTGRGVLSSSPTPRDWASRRAGSMVEHDDSAARLGGAQRDGGGRRRLADARRSRSR